MAAGGLPFNSGGGGGMGQVTAALQQQGQALLAIERSTAQMAAALQAQQQAHNQPGGGAGGGGLGLGAAYGMGMAAFGKALDKASKAMEILGGVTTTGAQKVEQLVKTFVPLGDTLIKFRDAVTGVTASIQAAQLTISQAMAFASAVHGAEMTQAPARRAAAGARNQAAALRGVAAGVQAPALINRSTFQGDIAYHEQQSLLPLQDVARKSAAEAAAARQSYHGSLAEEAVLRRRVGFHRSELARHTAEHAAIVHRENTNPAGGTDKAAKVEAALNMEREAQAVLQKSAELEAAITRSKELGLKATQAEAQASRDNLGVRKQHLSNLQAKEGRLMSQAERSGSLTHMEGWMGLHAARLIKKHGLGRASPEMIEAASRLAPDFIRKERQKWGPTRDFHRAAVEEKILEQGDVEQVRREQREEQTGIRQGEAGVEAKAAGEFGKQLDRFVEALNKVMDDKIHALVAAHRAGLQKQQANQ